MWTYNRHLLLFYLCFYEVWTTTDHGLPHTPTLSPTDPRSLWAELQEVTSDSIDASSRDKSPETLFQPTSFLNPGYGVLFQHVGRLHQSVYKHYLVIALRIPTLHHMPHQPEEWYNGCEDGIHLLQKLYENLTFKAIFQDDYCAKDRFKELYTDIAQILHSALPAILPNQVLPYVDYSFFNLTPSEMPTNPYQNNPTRNKRSIPLHTDSIPLIEWQQALDYYAKYGKPLPLDDDTIYADTLSSEETTPHQKRSLIRGLHQLTSHMFQTLGFGKPNTTNGPLPMKVQSRSKRFLGALVRGIGRVFKGANVFGKVFTGIKKIGGFIFKGIKGLFHRHKNTALIQAIRGFGSQSRNFALDKLYKFRQFHGLHLGKSSLMNTLQRTWHKARFWLRSNFKGHFNSSIYDAFHSLHADGYVDLSHAINGPFTDRYANLKFSTYRYKFVQMLRPFLISNSDIMTGTVNFMTTDVRVRNLFNYTNHMLSFLNYRQESIAYLEKIATALHNLLYGLEQLAMGKLTHALLPPNVLHKYLTRALHEVCSNHPNFVPLYTELHHYYESKMNSYTNDETYIYVQIPVFFTARNQPPLNLYRIHTVPVPLDLDTYEGKESKYTTLSLEYPFLATNGAEYMDITDAALDSCEIYHMDYLCENIHLTTDIKELTCAVSIYMDTIETSQWSPPQLNQLIQQHCNITYHEALYPSPTTLQTQDEILLANFQTYNWQLYCDEISDRPNRIQGALYTILNLDDLCTCAISTPLGRYLYESMHSCDSPDDKVTLYYTYNRPLISYDSSIDPKLAKRYSMKPYSFRAPDLEYHRHEPYVTSNGSLHMRIKRHTPDDPGFEQALNGITFPLAEAVRKMETKETTYLGTLFPVQVPMAVMDSPEDVQPANAYITSQENTVLDYTNTTLVNFIFNIVTLINAVVHCCLLISVKLSFRNGGWFNNFVVRIVQATLAQKTAQAVELLQNDMPPTSPSLIDLDFDNLDNLLHTPSTTPPSLFSSIQI